MKALLKILTMMLLQFGSIIAFADFQTQDEHIDDTVGASTVRLKIKAVQIRLSCPITIWLAQDSTSLGA
jgi:hypothetical protein